MLALHDCESKRNDGLRLIGVEVGRLQVRKAIDRLEMRCVLPDELEDRGAGSSHYDLQNAAEA
jgi:hypothetical protein